MKNQLYRFILGGMLFCLAIALYWLTGKWMSLYRFCARKWSIRLLRLGIVLLVVFCCRMWSVAGLIAVHLIVLFAAVEITACIMRRAGKRHREKTWYRVLHRIYRCGFVPAAITCLLISYGYYNMGHVVRTEYIVETDKFLEDYKVILITDTHYGTVQSPEVLRDKIDEMNALNPDAVVLGGDIVEEGTTKADMQEAFKVLGGIKSTYGTYYVYGNHDRQKYATAVSNPRTYTDKDLIEAIESNGIMILRDRWVPIGEDLILAGREDASRPSGRMRADELLEKADRNKFIIVADHQPVEGKENGAQGADLQLSGHTHAGQIFPVGCFNECFLGFNYGKYQKDGCSVVVSSGTAGWGFPVRTQGRCEYVVIQIKGSRK